MRPLRLEVSGFTTFRDSVEVDLSDATHFALVGPTGSGKSSLIDAMTFALYGTVSRLDLRSVLPVISQGKQEARVRLDFAIGEQEFTAVRVVRKLGPDRATTKEARLERGAEVLAGDADGVTAEVERLLGLTFEQFTRCVVLPQGEFARFMHDTPRARQDLLVRLLGLDVYERIAQRANQRAAAADATLAVQRQRLEEDLSFATDEALAEARARISQLEALRARIEDDEPRLEALREQARAAQEEEQAAVRAIGALTDIRAPADIDRRSRAEIETRDVAARAEKAAETAEVALTTAEETLHRMPERAPLERALEAFARRAGLAKESVAAAKEVAKEKKAAEQAGQAAAAAGVSAEEAQRALDTTRREHRAHDLVSTLVVGEPCPVCRHPVSELPGAPVPRDLTDAEAGAKAALEARAKAEAALRRATAALAKAEARAVGLTEQITANDAALTGYDEEPLVHKQLALIAEAEQVVLLRKKDAASARTQASLARKQIDQIASELKEARRALATARDGVGELAPPPLGGDDLAADWQTLETWAIEQSKHRREIQTAAGARARTVEADRARLLEAQREACIAAGIEDVRVPRDDCLKAIERQRGVAENIEVALDSSKQLKELIRSLEEQEQVARALGQHLKANAFERWVLRQALTTLVDGATQILLDLSAGQYSLTLDKNTNFAVIDHRNANLERSARTLSGGETFLASLALALALSDRIATLSANTAVRLESIFLDEGFGTLDDETLEMVATALESLSAMNRVVGVVTHVRALAERVPVRFEVRKGPSTSTVEKVLA